MASYKPVAINDGALELLKWIALVAMLADHVGKYLFNGETYWLYVIGRAAFPLFAFVVGYNLARPACVTWRSTRGMLGRLVVFGVLASAPMIALGGLSWGWWPLNIMASFFVAGLVVVLVERRGLARSAGAILVAVIGGAFVEFWWLGLAVTWSAFYWARQGGLFAAGLFIGSVASLQVINGSWWALAALPLIMLAHFVKIRLPRFPGLFYMIYPAHLGVLWAIKTYA